MQCAVRVAPQADVGCVLIRQLHRIDVDADELAAERQLGGEIHVGLAQFGANRQHDIGVGDQLLNG